MEDGGREGNFRERGWLMENTRGQNHCSVFEEQKKPGGRSWASKRGFKSEGRERGIITKTRGQMTLELTSVRQPSCLTHNLMAQPGGSRLGWWGWVSVVTRRRWWGGVGS